MDQENIKSAEVYGEQTDIGPGEAPSLEEAAPDGGQSTENSDEAKAEERHRRAAFAARRRMLEQQQAIDEAVKTQREADMAEVARYRELAARAAEDEVRREIAKIRQADPGISSVADLLSMPNAEAFTANVRRGLTLSEAYYLTNRDAILSSVRKAAGEEAQSRAMSKSHLTATSMQPSRAAAVPSDRMAMYRLLNPDATPAQIQRHYNDYMSS